MYIYANIRHIQGPSIFTGRILRKCSENSVKLHGEPNVIPVCVYVCVFVWFVCGMCVVCGGICVCVCAGVCGLCVVCRVWVVCTVDVCG